MLRNIVAPLRGAVRRSAVVQCRAYATSGPYGNFYYDKLQIEKSKNLKQRPDENTLSFASVFTDHMLVCEWDAKHGWDVPKIVPYQKIPLEPSATVLHYGLECFEGMKAYTGQGKNKNEHYLFRPEKNIERMNRSCARIALPTMKVDEVVKSIAKLVDMDKEWIPKQKGYSMYIRPTMISTEPTLGVAPAKHAMFYTILAPSGPYFKNGFKPVKLYADGTYVRAFHGGTGEYKLGANYAATVMPAILAAQKGYDQILWLTGEDKQVTEVGAMNLLFYWVNKNGEKELATASLDDGLVLPGVTRASVLELCREWGIKVNECKLTIDDVVTAIKEKRMIEVFGAGTAAIVSPVNCIGYQGVDYEVPTPADGLTVKLFNHILSIQHGELGHEWCRNIKDYI